MKKILLLILFLISIYTVSACEFGEIDTKANLYCDMNGLWQPSKNINDACENNFECASQLCYESKCAEKSVTEEYKEQKTLIDKILALLSGKECIKVGDVNFITKKYCDEDYTWQDLKDPGETCEDDYECLTEVCNEDNECAATGCDSDDDCAAGYTCVNSACVEIECEEDSDCETGYTCDADGDCILEPVTCTSDADCTQGVCDTTQDKCVECLEDSDCDIGKICSNKNCVSPSPGGPGGDLSKALKSSPGDSYIYEKTFTKIKPNQLYAFYLNELPIPVTGINFMVNTELTDVKFIIQRMLSRDSGIPEPKGLLYMYFYLNPDGIKDNYLKKSKILFRVPKDWLKENKVSKNDMVLQRYTTKWAILSTPSIILEDNNYYHYFVETPGFSWFAITSRPKEEKQVYIPPEIIVEEKCGNDIIDLEENCKTCPEDVKCPTGFLCSYEGGCVKKEISVLWWLIPLTIAAGVAVVLIIYFKKYYKRQTTFPKTSESPLENYIKKALLAKLPKEKIKAILLKKGWSEKQISVAFNKLKQ